MWYNFCKKENTLFFVLFLTICSNDKQYNFPKLSISSYFYLVWEKMCPWQFDWKLLNIFLHHDIRNEDELYITSWNNPLAHLSLYTFVFTQRVPLLLRTKASNDDWNLKMACLIHSDPLSTSYLSPLHLWNCDYCGI